MSHSNRLNGRHSVADLPRRDAGGMQERSGVRTTAFKSRLCTRFMQKGDCSYGPNCHFAHGQDDLQNAGRPDMSSAVSTLLVSLYYEDTGNLTF